MSSYRFAPLAVAALTTATLSGCAANQPPGTTSQGGGATLSVSLTTPNATASAPPSPTVDSYANDALIDHVSWTEAIDGPRLRVFPTPAGRATTFPSADGRAWLEVLDLAPNADSPGMRDQFICHWVWARLVAPDKPSWNLEPWRPAVGYQGTVQASCNPGGPER